MSEMERYDDKDEFLSRFEELRPDLFFPDAWTKEQKAEASELVRPQRTKTAMFASIPMRCEGSKCVVADSCPLLARNLAPVGKPCPIEMSIVQQFMNDYILEMNVDENSMSEVSLVRELVDQEVQYLRKTKILAKEHFIQQNPVGVDSDGNVILRKELHQAVDYEDRILKRKQAILKQMNATREAKAKLGMGQVDTAQVVAGLFNQLTELQSKQDQLIRQKLGQAERDDYIEAEIIDNPEEE